MAKAIDISVPVLWRFVPGERGLGWENVCKLAQPFGMRFTKPVKSQGEFNSADLVAALAAGEYEDGIESNSGWAEGDFVVVSEFTSSDLFTSALPRVLGKQCKAEIPRTLIGRPGPSAAQASIIKVLADGGYGQGPRHAVIAALPEPSSIILVLLGLIGVPSCHREAFESGRYRAPWAGFTTSRFTRRCDKMCKLTHVK